MVSKILFISMGTSEVKKCPNCGKELKPGEGLRKEEGHFCCDACCERGPKPDKEKSKTCEFC
jgi:hypothetical protein